MSNEVSVSASENNSLKFKTVGSDTALDAQAKSQLDGNATYAEDVKLEDFFAQLEPVAGKVRVEGKELYRGFIRFDTTGGGAEGTKVCLESVNTKNWNSLSGFSFWRFMPLKWRTNLRSQVHNMSVRTTLARAVLKKFDGLALSDMGVRGLLCSIQGEHLNEGLNKVSTAEFTYSVSSGNRQNALERWEVDALRQRYFDLTLNKKKLAEIAKATILKIAAQATGDLKNLPEIVADTFFKDYLQEGTLEGFVKEMLADVEEVEDGADDAAKGVRADANLQAMRNSCAVIREKLVRACINAHCRGLLGNTLNDLKGANITSYKVPENQANKIADFMTSYLTNLSDKDGTEAGLSGDEIQKMVKDFCKVGGGEKSCLGRCLQEIFENFRKEAGGKPENFDAKIKEFDFVAAIAGKIQQFMQGYKAINAVADAVCAVPGEDDAQRNQPVEMIQKACGVNNEDAEKILDFFGAAGEVAAQIEKTAKPYMQQVEKLEGSLKKDGLTSSGDSAADALSKSGEADAKKRMYEAFKAAYKNKKSELERLKFSSLKENEESRKNALAVLEVAKLPEDEAEFTKLVQEKLTVLEDSLEPSKEKPEQGVAQPEAQNPPADQPADGEAAPATEPPNEDPQPGDIPEERREESEDSRPRKVFKDILRADYLVWFCDKCFGKNGVVGSNAPLDEFFKGKYTGKEDDAGNEKKTFGDRYKNTLLTQVADEFAGLYWNYGITEGVSAAGFRERVDNCFLSIEIADHKSEVSRMAELTEADFVNLPKNKNDLTHYINVGMALKSWYGVAVSVKNVGGNSSKLTTVPMAIWSAVLALKATKSTYDESHRDAAGFLKGLNERFLKDNLLKNFYSIKDPHSVYNKLKGGLLGNVFLGWKSELAGEVKAGLQSEPGTQAELRKTQVPSQSEDQILAKTLSNCTRQIYGEIEDQVNGGFLGFFRGALQDEVAAYRASLDKLDAQRLYLLIGGSADRPDASVAKDPLADIEENRAVFVEMAVLNYQRKLNVAFEDAIGAFADEVANNPHYLEEVSPEIPGKPNSRTPQDGRRIAKAGFIRLRALIHKHCANVKVQENATLHSVMSKSGDLIAAPLISSDELRDHADFETLTETALQEFYKVNVLSEEEKNDLENDANTPEEYKDRFRRTVKNAMLRVYPDLMTAYQGLETFETYLKAGMLSNCYNTIFLDVTGDKSVTSQRGAKIGEKFLTSAATLLANHCNQLKEGLGKIKKTFANRYFDKYPALLVGLDDQGKANYRNMVESSVVYTLSTDPEARESIMDINNLGGIREKKKKSIFSFLMGDANPSADAEGFVTAYLGNKSNKDGKSLFALLSEKIYQVESEWDPEVRLGKILESDDFKSVVLAVPKQISGAKTDADAAKLSISLSDAVKFDENDADDSPRSVLMSMAHTVTDVCLKELLVDMRTNKQSYWSSDENLRSQSVKKLQAKIDKYWKNLMGNLSYFTEVEATDRLHLNPKDVGELLKYASYISDDGIGGQIYRQLLLRTTVKDALKGTKAKTFADLYGETMEFYADKQASFLRTSPVNGEMLVTPELIANHKTSLVNAIESVGLEIKDVDLPRASTEQDDPVLAWYRKTYENFYVDELKGSIFSEGSQGDANAAVSGVNDSFRRNLAALASKLSKTLDCGALVEAFVRDNGIDPAEADGLKAALKARMNDSAWTFLGPDGKTQMTLSDLVAQAYASAAYEMAVEPDKAKAAAAVVDAWKRHVDQFLMAKLGDKYVEALKTFARSLSSDKAETYDFDALKGLSSVEMRRKIVYDLKVADSVKGLCDERLTVKRFQDLFAAEGLTPKREFDFRPEYQDLNNPLKSVIDCQNVKALRDDFAAYVRGKMAELHKNAIRTEGIAAGEVSAESETERCKKLIEEQFGQFCNKRLLQRRAINRIYAEIMGNETLRNMFEKAVREWSCDPGFFSFNRKIAATQRPAALLWMYQKILGMAKDTVGRFMKFPASVGELMAGKLFDKQNFTGVEDFMTELKNYLRTFPDEASYKQLRWLLGGTEDVDAERLIGQVAKSVLDQFEQKDALKVSSSETQVLDASYKTTEWRVMDDAFTKLVKGGAGGATLKANNRNVLIFTTENKKGGK